MYTQTHIEKMMVSVWTTTLRENDHVNDNNWQSIISAILMAMVTIFLVSSIVLITNIIMT